jgi:hypothetical protein
MREDLDMLRTFLRTTAIAIGVALAASSFMLDASASASSPAASRPGSIIDPGDGRYAPVVDPAQFVDRIDNPYLPLLPGTRWVYEGGSGRRKERTVVTVLDDRRLVMGIRAVVVRDVVSLRDQLIEDTYDWFAQDRAGNVWYLGEKVKNYRNGKLVDSRGSWEAGVDGALPGIVMPASPRVGDAYRQEYYPGEAEDMFEIIHVGRRAVVPAGNFSDVLVTKDWNPLEPKVIEQKSYARGVGMISERKVAGDTGRAELVRHRPAR